MPSFKPGAYNSHGLLFKLVLPQFLVVLSQKRLANVSKHCELSLRFHQKETFFSKGKMYTTTAVDHMGEKPEVMSLNLVVPIWSRSNTHGQIFLFSVC